MAKMSDDDLLKLLQDREEDAAEFTWGTLARERQESAKAYYRQPYGNEEAGWSSLVTGEVADTIEWMLPDLVDLFVSNEQAVEFEPAKAEEVKNAEDATHAANYVFYRQNNGFLVLLTAFKDALMLKTGVLHWRKEERETVEKVPFKDVPQSALASLEESDDDEFEYGGQTGMAPVLEAGMPVFDPETRGPKMEPTYSGVVKRTVKKKHIVLEAVDPNLINIPADWNSPLLENCPYVQRVMEVSLSDLKQMNLKVSVTASELAASTQPRSGDAMSLSRRDRQGLTDDTRRFDTNEIDSEDESLTRGWLRFEWVLADVDGDGIAERRQIIRLEGKILDNEEFPEVPIAIGSPVLVQHHWDGMSIAECVVDLQEIKTELARGVINNAYASNNPRKTVLVNQQGAPQADIDDVLDSRPGGMIRVKAANALGMEPTAFVGNQMLPLLDHVDQWVERRTGVNKMSQGIDPNVLRTDRTAYETAQLSNAAAKRIKLIGRMFGEVLMKPAFRGILRLLTEGDMEPLFFRLNGRFVSLSPNEWSDQYALTCNVGTGTGDADRQIAALKIIAADQMAFAQSPLGQGFVTPHQIWTTRSQMYRLMGQKNTQDYLLEPPKDAKLPAPPPQPPDPSIQVAMIRAQQDEKNRMLDAQLDAHKIQWQAETERQRQSNEYQLQAQNDLRDAAAADAESQRKHDLDMARIAADVEMNAANNRTSVIVARIAHPEGLPDDIEIDPDTGDAYVKPDLMPDMLAAVKALTEHVAAPKRVVRDESGRATGVEQGGQVRPLEYGPDGKVIGLQ